MRAATSRGYWVTNKDASGLLFMVDWGPHGSVPLTDRSGKRYEFKFTDAMRAPGRTVDNIPLGMP